MYEEYRGRCTCRVPVYLCRDAGEVRWSADFPALTGPAFRMITYEHCSIRSAEADDAVALKRFYQHGAPLRAALLDQRREPIVPGIDELREVLGRREGADKTAFYIIEDRIGCVCGCCVVRGVNLEILYAEFALLLYDDAAYQAPVATEAFCFAVDRAFGRLNLNKMVSQCMDGEKAYRDFLLRHGFRSEGVQRETVFAGGRSHDLESFSLLRRDFAPDRFDPPLTECRFRNVDNVAGRPARG